jgi:hypothetical protein
MVKYMTIPYLSVNTYTNVSLLHYSSMHDINVRIGVNTVISPKGSKAIKNQEVKKNNPNLKPYPNPKLG